LLPLPPLSPLPPLAVVAHPAKARPRNRAKPIPSGLQRKNAFTSVALLSLSEMRFGLFSLLPGQDGRARTLALGYTPVNIALIPCLMRWWALRPRVPKTQTLARMAEKRTNEGTHRILVAAPSVVDACPLAGWLEREGFEVMTATDSQESLQIAGSSWQPEVVLLDVTLPEVAGFSVCKRVRAANRRALVFVLGASSREEEVRSLDAGADDYVATPFASEVLLARVRAHLRSRREAGERRILEFGDLWLDARNYATRVKGEWVDLRPQEFRLLIALAQSYGVAVNRRELIRRVGATWRGASSRPVDIHVSRIRACVERPSDYTYIHTIRGVGYRFEPILKGP
jgi:DNA-binding response OmpR family regulator